MTKDNKIKNERILIFGGTGSLGKTLIRRFFKDNHVCAYSRDESKHWTLRNEIDDSNLTFFIGNIRDKHRCLEAILYYRPTYVIIASALKHVDICERSPCESVLTNIEGVSNVVKVVKENINKLDDIKSVLMVSTDKACLPINVYGMCKAIGERVITSDLNDNDKIKYIAVRYGNVLESRGSIIPLFKYQCENKDSITLTHENMTRYVMTLEQSADLIESALINAKSGETWIPDLKSMKIIDLAEIFSEIYNKKIKIIGMRPGEKLHEDLISTSESLRCRKEGIYYAILPSFTQPFNSVDYSMNSLKSLMTKDQLKNYLQELGILDMPLSSFVGKTIKEF